MAVKLQEARVHNTLANSCYHCGQPYLELTKDGLECPFCGWVWYLSQKGLDKLMRKRQHSIIG